MIPKPDPPERSIRDYPFRWACTASQWSGVDPEMARFLAKAGERISPNPRAHPEGWAKEKKKKAKVKET